MLRSECDRLEELKLYFERYYEELCHTAFTYLKDRQEAEDVVQDFFYKLWEKKLLNTITGDFLPYAKRAVVNGAINIQKKRRLHPFQEIGDVQDDEIDFEVRIQYEGMLDDVVQKIGLLPDRQKQVIRMSVYDNLKYTEISERLNLSVNTIKTHIKNAYKSLRKQ